MSQRIGWVSTGIPSNIHYNLLRALDSKDGLSYKQWPKAALRHQVDEFTDVLVNEESLFLFDGDLNDMVKMGWVTVSDITYHITEKGREVLRGLRIISQTQGEVSETEHAVPAITTEKRSSVSEDEDLPPDMDNDAFGRYGPVSSWHPYT